MIDKTLSVVVAELNEFIKSKLRIDQDKVLLSTLINQDGTPAVKDSNVLIVSLVNIQEEKIIPTKGASQTNPPVYLNLFVLFSASFDGKLTTEGIKFISMVIAFFQSKRMFDPQNTPGLPDAVEKLIFDINNLTFHEQSNLWSSLGAKYMPSVLYKVRLITIEEGLMSIPSIGVGGMDTDIS